MLENIDSSRFNIFKIRELTKGNELVIVSSYLLAKNDLFNFFDIEGKSWFNFISSI